ncbi:hypothetical protein [Flavobacterium sp. ZE23DGlu08]|uniref:hypothetical protein n=1 Tax=Flavobacterium sp. ZE23DGlu08 TaxID=3059026 RepID=UPI00265ECD95|nr:hypothetical protein [Flavobacterium sp. ZE23DGlu08]WKL44888.1 hypothetical protein Q1W72_04575 [Flavobacterium sp. ZE23DGlu08]
MDTKLISRIAYSDIFNKSENIKSVINKINPEKAIVLLAIINKYHHEIHKGFNSELKFILNEWLVNSDKDLKSKVINSYSKLVEKRDIKNYNEIDLSSINIINRIATLRTIELLVSQSDLNSDGNDYESITLENVFKLYLLVNDELSDRQEKLFQKWLPNIHEKTKEIRFHLYLGLSHVDLTSESISKKLMSEVLKFVQFEKWLKRQNVHQDIVNTYLKNLESNDWYDLFSKVFQLNKIAINNHIVSKEMYPELWIILEYFSSHEETSKEWNELTNIRKKPLYKLKNQDYIIIDFSFLLDKFFSGIYHDLIELSKKTYINNFHLDYSKNFVEGVLLVNSLKSVFGKSYIQYSENRIKLNIKKGIENLALPDYYIRNGSKIFIFECKNSFLSNINKINLDCDLIENEIKDKFFESLGKKKAIKQLLNFINLSEDKQYTFFDNLKKHSNLKYYPVLVVTDNTLTSIGFNKLFHEYFQNASSNVKSDLVSRIKPLTIIHINDFLYYNESLKKLDVIIQEFHKYTSNKNAIDGMLSFSNFIDFFKFPGKRKIKRESIDHILKDSLLPSEHKKSL